MICPTCNHARTSNDDPEIPDYECPACGIIYDKYKPKINAIDGQPAVFEIDKSRPNNTFRNPPTKPKDKTQQIEDQKTANSAPLLKKPVKPKEIIYTLILMVLVVNIPRNKITAPPESNKNKPIEYTPPITYPTPEPSQKTDKDKANSLKDEMSRRAAQVRKDYDCNQNVQCVGAKIFTVEARAACIDGLERMAIYRHKWTDNWHEDRIIGYKWKDESKTIMQGIGNKLEIENGFGAWQQVAYACEVNAADSRLINIIVENKAGRVLAGDDNDLVSAPPHKQERVTHERYRYASPEQMEIMRQRERELAKEY